MIISKGIVTKEGKTTKGGMLRTASPIEYGFLLEFEKTISQIRGDLACAVLSYSKDPMESL